MSQPPLIQALLKREAFPHPCAEVRLIETHISWVLLTGKYAYKIKKPLDLGFLDYSTLALRKHFCEKEVQLNRHYTSQVYLEVVPLYGTETDPEFSSTGPVIEYAVKMREFPQEQLLNERLKNGSASLKLILKSAACLAQSHLHSMHCPPEEGFGSSAQITEPVQQNFSHVSPLLKNNADHLQLQHLEKLTLSKLAEISHLIEERKQQGFVRACHGDAHLGNIAIVDEEPIFFDCIEFNDSFRWTDVMADLGFLIMDLESKGYNEFAAHTLNEYLQLTGDYSGLAVLDFYKTYRATVRAKVMLFQMQQTESPTEKQTLLEKYRHAIALATEFLTKEYPSIVITQGVCGSGKTTLATILAGKMSKIYLSSDRERKRSNGLEPDQQAVSPVNQDFYSHEMHQKTYQHLLQLTQQILNYDYSVIIDASFIKLAHRQQFQLLAERCHCPLAILQLQANSETIKQRLHDRLDSTDKSSDAYLDVLEMQLATVDPLTEEELAQTISVDMNNYQIDDLISDLQALLTRWDKNNN